MCFSDESGSSFCCLFKLYLFQSLKQKIHILLLSNKLKDASELDFNIENVLLSFYRI